MQVLFIYISVMMLRNVMNSGAEEIADLSDWCRKGRKIDFYLTSGAGFSDLQLAMIASEDHLNCTLIFKVRSGNFIMLVVEFPDHSPEDRVYFSQSDNNVTIGDFDKKRQCQEDEKKVMYFGLSQDSMSVSISSRGLMSTVKITSTSMRDSKGLVCSKSTEITCAYKGKKYCMTSKALCDNNVNCADKRDEAHSTCKEVTLTFVMIICTFLTGVLTFSLIASAAYTAIPNRREIFIHAYDQTLSLFDFDDIVQSEIHLQELFPIEDRSSLR